MQKNVNSAFYKRSDLIGSRNRIQHLNYKATQKLEDSKLSVNKKDGQWSSELAMLIDEVLISISFQIIVVVDGRGLW